tara:strand:+ start:14710 stop:16506 length:1797 start_codon:yes stop_codon:yes gene_type:complete
MVERTFISLPSQLQLVERLQHLIYLSSSLIFVSGAAGSGKSTLTENLSNLLPSDLQQVYISLTNVPTATKLRQQIISQLFDKALFNAEDKLLDSIIRLQQTESRSQNRLIIIDNANNLPADFIIELCELFSDTDFAQNNTLNVLLLADEMTNQQYLEYIETHLVSRIGSLLNHIELTLPALSSQEANGLLQHNFQQVDYQAKLQHQDALNKQLKLCHGNPQKIIKLADDLSQGLLEPITHSWIRTRLPAILLMLFLVGIVSIFAVYLYPKFIPSKPVADTLIDINTIQPADKINIASTIVTTQEKQPAKLAGSWADMDIEITDNKHMVGLSDETEKRVVISGLQILELTVLTDNVDNQIIEGQVIDSNVTDTQGVDAKQLLTPPVSDHQIPLLLKLPTENNSQKTIAHLTNKQAPKNETTEPGLTSIITSAREEQQIQTTKTETNNSDLLSEDSNRVGQEEDDKQLISIAESNGPIKKPAVVPDKVKEAVSSEEKSIFTATDILLAKVPTHYTIQLSGMASRQYLTEFQQQYNTAQENVFTYQTVRNNQPWFVVVYGEYTSIKAAQLAANNLPSVFNNMSTWVKAWRVVHNDLRLNDE